jgi:hypothetical protein
MAKNLVIALDDDLVTMIHEAAGEDISAWIAQAARDRLTRETWEGSNRTADALGLNEADGVCEGAVNRRSPKSEWWTRRSGASVR